MKNTSLFLILLLFLKISFAQDITGSLGGKIFDSTGTPLNGVNILLVSENLQGTRGGSTDAKGYFPIIASPAGIYQADITMVGFKKIVIYRYSYSVRINDFHWEQLFCSRNQ